MLFSCGQDRAIGYLNENLSQIGSWGELLQCTAIDIIRKHTREGISDVQKVCNLVLCASMISNTLYSLVMFVQF